MIFAKGTTVVKVSQVISRRTVFLTHKQCLATVASQTATDIDQQQKDEWNSARPYKDVPGPNLWQLMKLFRPGGTLDGLDLNRIQEEFHKRYGNICKMPGLPGRSDIVFVYEPEDFEKIFRNEGPFPVRAGIDSQVYYRTQWRKDLFKGISGLGVAQGEEWWDFRKKVNPIMMKPMATKVYVPKMDEISRDIVKTIQASKDAENRLTDDFLPLLNKWALESVAYVFMGIRIGLLGDKKDPTAEKFMKNVKYFFDYTYKLDVEPSIWKFYKTPTFKAAMKNTDETIDGALYFLEQGKKVLEEKKRANIVTAEEEKGVLEKLLEIDEKVALVMTMDSIIAGVDTTSTTFFQLLFNLANNPEKQTILRQEILSILPKKDSELTAENMNSLPYLRACLKESHRYSPIFGNARSAGRDMVLQGYQMPKLTNFFMVNHMQLRNDAQYERSSEFIPERFLRSSKDTNSGCPRGNEAHPFVNLPFGFGSRMCIGRRFAELEIETLIVRTLQQFSVEWKGPAPTYLKGFGSFPIGATHFVFKEFEN